MSLRITPISSRSLQRRHVQSFDLSEKAWKAASRITMKLLSRQAVQTRKIQPLFFVDRPLVPILSEELQGSFPLHQVEFPSFEPRSHLMSAVTNKAGREWAHVVDVNKEITNFHDLVPDMAREYPFELDTFQKEAVYHLENGDSVFVAAHTSAGKT